MSSDELPKPRFGVDQMTLSFVVNPMFYKKGSEPRFGHKYSESFWYTTTALLESGAFIHKHGKPNKSGYPVHTHFLIRNGRTICTFLTGIMWGKSFVKLVLNPNKIQPGDLAIICTEIKTCTPPGRSPVDFIREAEVSVIEMFMDIAGKSPDDFVVLATNIQDRQTYHDTVYLGDRGRPRSVCIYDKAQELKKSTGIDVGHKLTRLEVRLRMKKLSYGALLDGAPLVPYRRLFHRRSAGLQDHMRHIRSDETGRSNRLRWLRGAQKGSPHTVSAEHVPQRPSCSRLVQAGNRVDRTAGTPTSLRLGLQSGTVQLIARRRRKSVGAI